MSIQGRHLIQKPYISLWYTKISIETMDDVYCVDWLINSCIDVVVQNLITLAPAVYGRLRKVMLPNWGT